MPECFASDKPAALAVAALTLSDGTYKLSDTETTTLANTNTTQKKQEETQPITKPVTITRNLNGKKDKSGYYDLSETMTERRFTIFLPNRLVRTV